MTRERHEQQKKSYFRYPIQILESNLRQKIEAAINSSADINFTEAPQASGFDYGVNLSGIAKLHKLNSDELSSKIAEETDGAESVGPYLNIRLDMSFFGHLVTNQILEMGDNYGKESIGQGQRIVIDMSSPNIAKRMSYGHLRSTVIGDALANLYKAAGYEVIRDNHIGDWGTQFGKLIVAIKTWGSEQSLQDSDDPIGLLQDLYVKFHSEDEKQKLQLRNDAHMKISLGGNHSVAGLEVAMQTIAKEIMDKKGIPESALDLEKIREDALDKIIISNLETEARAWFKKLESGDTEAVRIWKLCVDLSIVEFNRIYDILGIKFDVTYGESFYQNMLDEVIEKTISSGAGTISNGALVIDMQGSNLGVAMVQKSDGTSLYMTRDLACAIYRQEEMGADKAIYVVGEDQKQYFAQLFEALDKMGYKIGRQSEHVHFGMVSLPEGKMSTRKGRVILLKDVLDEGFRKTECVIDLKSPHLKQNPELKETIVRQVAVGALKWNDLFQDPKRSITFDWDKALNLEGNSALYVQYTAIRANSILKVYRRNMIDTLTEETLGSDYQDPSERALIRQLAAYPKAINDAIKSSSPAKIATYAFELAKRFNTFYGKYRIIEEGKVHSTQIRLKLAAATYQTIKNSLAILGIEVPNEI